MIKPVLRLLGSKFRKYNLIKSYFLKSNKTIFVELFGGTGIISVNIKNEFKDVQVILNDYDYFFPLTKKKVKQNLTTFEGLGQYTTKSATNYFNIRVKNNLWKKVEEYNKIIDQIELLHSDYKQIDNIKNSFIFIDPPYYKNEKIYKNTMDHNELYLYVLKLLKNNNDVLITYNDSDFIKNLYKYKQSLKIKTEIYSYVGCNPINNKKVNEILISNI